MQKSPKLNAFIEVRRMVTLQLRNGLWMRKALSCSKQLGVMGLVTSLKTRNNGNPVNSRLLWQMVLLVLEQKPLDHKSGESQQRELDQPGK